MPMDKRALQERLKSLVAEALQEVLTEDGALKEPLKATVKEAGIRRLSQAAEQEALSLIDEALGVREAGFGTER